MEMGLLNRLLGRSSNSQHEKRVKDFRNPTGTGILRSKNSRESPALCPTCGGSHYEIIEDGDGVVLRCDGCPSPLSVPLPDELVAELGTHSPDENNRETSPAGVAVLNVEAMSAYDEDPPTHYCCPNCDCPEFHPYVGRDRMSVKAIECTLCDFRMPDSVNWDKDNEWSGHEAGR